MFATAAMRNAITHPAARMAESTGDLAKERMMGGKNDIAAIRLATGAFCQSILASILPPVREAARFNGYAIAVHGSLSRDIDLIAVAWTAEAQPAAQLVDAVRGAICGVLGNCLLMGEPGQKPHGRIAYTLIHPGFAGEIDLSVIPPRTEPN